MEAVLSEDAFQTSQFQAKEASMLKKALSAALAILLLALPAQAGPSDRPGTGVAASNLEGNMPLVLACQGKDKEAAFREAKALLDAGADPNLMSPLVMSPLMACAQTGNAKAVALLLKKGADPHLAGIKGETPLMAATWSGSTKIVSMLLERGADPNCREEELGSTALMRAAMDGHAGVAKLLLDKGANPNAATKGGATALMLASKNGHSGVAKLLLGRGAIPMPPGAAPARR